MAEITLHDMMMSQLEAQVTALQQSPAPTTQLVDALNALSAHLVSVDLQRAIQAAKQSHALARSLQYPRGEAASLIQLGWLHMQEGELDAALLQAKHAEYIGICLGDYAVRTGAAYIVASAHQRAGNYTKAEHIWLGLLELAEQQCDRTRRADYLAELAILHEEQANFTHALALKRQALSIYTELSDPNQLAALNNVAFAMTKLGLHREAWACAEHALALCADDQLVWRATILHTMGRIRLNEMQVIEAQRLFDESLALCNAPGGHKPTAVEVLIDQAKAHFATHDWLASLSAFTRAADLAQHVQTVSLQAEAHLGLHRTYVRLHVSDDAAEQHERYLACRNTVACQRIEHQVALMRAEAEASQQKSVWMRESAQWLALAA